MLYRGAEAVLTVTSGKIEKKRVVKGYRIPQLDAKLRTERTRLEERILRRARRAGVPVPAVIDSQGTVLILEYLGSETVQKILGKKPQQAEKLGKAIGEVVAALHETGIVHGDLTTSNMIVQKQLFLIDFGLARLSRKAEDRGVDLYLLSEALAAAHHYLAPVVWRNFLKAYRQHMSSSSEVYAAYKRVASRRRYKGYV